MSVWKDPTTDKYFKSTRLGVFQAQLVMPGDISAIEAKVILQEVLGLARQALGPSHC